MKPGLPFFFDDSALIPEPSSGHPYFGQDARYPGNRFSFRDNGDNTVSDLNTGLTWQRGYSRIAFASYDDYVVKIAGYLDSINEKVLPGGYGDWRVPTVKEQLSIADFSGNVNLWIPYIDTLVFDFAFPGENTDKFDPPGTRKIDAQHVSSNKYAENLELAGYSDWYLPDVKELQSIVDYSRNDPALNTASLEMSDPDGWFWSSTSYLGKSNRMGIYIAFGKAVNYLGVDTHGAGALRGDFKSGDPADWPYGIGPQQDEIRIYNYVRAVRRMNLPIQ